jgi:hypothetical protein
METEVQAMNKNITLDVQGFSIWDASLAIDNNHYERVIGNVLAEKKG